MLEELKWSNFELSDNFQFSIGGRSSFLFTISNGLPL